jgi:hypothetical protein
VIEEPDKSTPPPLRQIPGPPADQCRDVDMRSRWFQVGIRHTKCHTDLRAAWAKIGGPEEAIALMRSALDDAKGRDIVMVDRKGDAHTAKIKDWGPILGLLPYIARKMPESVEHMDLTPQTTEELAVLLEWGAIARAKLMQEKSEGSAPPSDPR